MSEYRITVVGGGAVGKSAITVRFVAGNFIDRYDPTIEDSYRRQLEVDNQACVVDILDTAGQEELSALLDQYLKTGDGTLLVYSVIDRVSFEVTGRLRQGILRMKAGFPDFPIVLVANKSDLENERVVSEEEGKELALKYNVPYIETSALRNENIQEAFHTLIRSINKFREAHPKKSRNGNSPGKKRQGGISKEKSCTIL